MKNINCYICKKLIKNNHHKYPELCLECGEFNLKKRFQEYDLSGFKAFISGGRIKIGFETAIKLLRCGAKVAISTRFKNDANKRFSQVHDYEKWRERLIIYAADFRIPKAVMALAERITMDFGSLDILINNAAQTVRKPPAYYRHLFENIDTIDEKAQMEINNHVLDIDSSDILTLAKYKNRFFDKISDPFQVAKLSQIPVIPGDEIFDYDDFPLNKFDGDGQQEDRRSKNSWMMNLSDIHLGEFMEVLLINVVSPFILITSLYKIMKNKNVKQKKYIVNVTAMEGNFFDPEKNCRHPHTNMAKAAINMMTRTAAIDFQKNNILMFAVDPGYITNEKPFPKNVSYESRRSKMAIDAIDGAARICDPIFRCIAGEEVQPGLLYKNYNVYPW